VEPGGLLQARNLRAEVLRPGLPAPVIFLHFNIS
jgi:hypothetical protein